MQFGVVNMECTSPASSTENDACGKIYICI